MINIGYIWFKKNFFYSWKIKITHKENYSCGENETLQTNMHACVKCEQFLHSIAQIGGFV